MRPSHPFEGYPSEGRAQGGEVTRRFWLATVLSGMLVLAACGGSPAKTSQGKPAQAPGNPCVPGSCGAGKLGLKVGVTQSESRKSVRAYVSSAAAEPWFLASTWNV